MTPTEFKAWFDGFTENCDGPPNEKQWDRIKARVAEINGVSITYPVYIDRYWSYPRPYQHNPYWYSNGAYCSTFSAGGTGVQVSNNLGGNLGQLQNMNVSNNFDSTAAMYAAGRADADQIN